MQLLYANKIFNLHVKTDNNKPKKEMKCLITELF
jgi:hypothetical protein